MAGKSKQRAGRGGLYSNLEVEATPQQLEQARIEADNAFRIDEHVKATPDTGVGTKVNNIHPSLLGGKRQLVGTDAQRQTKDVSNKGVLVPINVFPDPSAPNGFAFQLLPEDEEAVLKGFYCGSCLQEQRYQGGSKPGSAVEILRDLPVEGDRSHPDHYAHEGGYCLPIREGAESCGNKLSDGIFFEE